MSQAKADAAFAPACDMQSNGYPPMASVACESEEIRSIRSIESHRSVKVLPGKLHGDLRFSRYLQKSPKWYLSSQPFIASPHRFTSPDKISGKFVRIAAIFLWTFVPWICSRPRWSFGGNCASLWGEASALRLERFILEANSFYDMSRFRTIPDAEGQHGREDPGAGENMIWGSFHALFSIQISLHIKASCSQKLLTQRDQASFQADDSDDAACQSVGSFAVLGEANAKATSRLLCATCRMDGQKHWGRKLGWFFGRLYCSIAWKPGLKGVYNPRKGKSRMAKPHGQMLKSFVTHLNANPEHLLK